MGIASVLAMPLRLLLCGYLIASVFLHAHAWGQTRYLALNSSQENLVPKTSFEGAALAFDWPAVRIGVGSYEEGPTGITVFEFPTGAKGVVDASGGSPGSILTDALRHGDETLFVNAVVFSGSSSYGLEAAAGVLSGLLDYGTHNGDWLSIPVVPGAVVYDFDSRLNDIYADKKLALATLASLREGVFPLGAYGAGRSVTQGKLFDCGAFSGQGGAFVQIGEVKVAAFTVVNAEGVVTDRHGRMVNCSGNHAWGVPPMTANALRWYYTQGKPEAVKSRGKKVKGLTKNTTISLIVTNRRMPVARLQALAKVVHISMGRGVQPFSTKDDGDTLFAVSTHEAGDIDNLDDVDQIEMAAMEAMWDAILSSVPPLDAFVPPKVPVTLPEGRLNHLVGRYRFGASATMSVTVEAGGVFLRAEGRELLDFTAKPVELKPISDKAFYADGRYLTRVEFRTGPDGQAEELTINPGHWALKGLRLSNSATTPSSLSK